REALEEAGDPREREELHRQAGDHPHEERARPAEWAPIVAERDRPERRPREDQAREAVRLRREREGDARRDAEQDEAWGEKKTAHHARTRGKMGGAFLVERPRARDEVIDTNMALSR